MRKAVNLSVDFLAQIAPDIFIHGDESSYYLRVELTPGPALNFFPRRLYRLRRAIRAIGRDCVERVGYRKHPGAERNFLAFESSRIPSSVKSLLMGVDNFGSLGQEWNLLQYLIAVKAVLSHNRHFVGRQLVRLAQNVVGDRHLPNIVEKRAASDHADFIRR